jgi:LysM repeat protein
LAILLVVAATVAGGVFLTFSDDSAREAAARQPTSTAYRIATLTPQVTASPSQPAPTATAVPTITPAPPRATVTPAVTVPLPTAPPPPASLPTAVPSPVPCRIAAGWVPYTVQAGDTLFLIGLRYGVMTDRMREANCLTSDLLTAGDVIYVPPVSPSLPQPSSTPLPPAATFPAATLPTGYDGICTDAGSNITSPGVGTVLSGVVQFYGTAVHADFQFYKLEIRPEGSSTSADFATFLTADQPVSGGLLGSLDTAVFANGEYWIRLVVVDNTGNYPERCSILYTIRN